MRHIYAVLLSSALLHIGVQAQTDPIVQLHDEHGDLVNGTVITGECLWSTDTVSLLATLTASNTTVVNVRRYELWPVSGSKNFFCWGVCYLPVNGGANPTWVSTNAVTMEPGVQVNNFHSYYQPQGQTGATYFRFVWFDEANPFGPDTAWVDIQVCGQVGIEETVAASTSLSAWPLPSAGQDVQLDYTLDRQANGTQVVLYTMLGEQVRRVTLAAQQGRVMLPTAGMVPGIYFANIEREGRVLMARKVVVTR